jgi:hypothetical protein
MEQAQMTSPKRRTKLAKTVFTTYVVALCFLTLISGLYIEFLYSAVMPRSPQSETGRIYPKWFKSGGTVYVNRKERDRSDFAEYRLMRLVGLSMLLGFGMGVRLGWWDIGHKGPYSKF